MPEGPLFPQSPEIPYTIDFVDIVASVAYVVYDGMLTNNQSSESYLLAPTISSDVTPVVSTNEDDDMSSPLYTKWDANGSTSKNLDFDLPAFTKAVTVEGDALVRFTVAGNSTSDIDTFVAKGLVRKWDGASESDLGSDNRASFTLTASKLATFFMKIPVSKTIFRKGEQLRFSLELTYSNPGAANSHCAIAHNPRDTSIAMPAPTQNFESGGSRLVVAVPYKLP